MRIPVNGVSWHVEQAGVCWKSKDVPVLVLLHGFTGAGNNWRPYVDKWGTKYRLLLVDIIGHGQSDAPVDPSRYAMHHATADLVKILDYLQIEQCDMLGYSMGGRLALATAVRTPGRIRALVLEGSTPGIADPEERKLRVERDEALARRIERDGIAAFVSYWESLPLFASQTKLPTSVRTKIRQQRLNNREVGLANSLRGMGTGAQPSLWHKLPKLNLPVLLLAGEWDKKFCRIGRAMRDKLPQADFYEVAHAGHTVHVEQAAVFDTIVMDFLNRIDCNT